MGFSKPEKNDFKQALEEFAAGYMTGYENPEMVSHQESIGTVYFSGLEHGAKARTKHEKIEQTVRGNKCPGLNCSEWIPKHRIFCKDHWFIIPAFLRQRITECCLSKPGSEDHYSAVAEAIQFVQREGEQS